MSEFQKGMLVQHVSLGLGKVVATEPSAVHVFFATSDNRFATKLRLPMALPMLCPAGRDGNAWLAGLPAFALNAKTGRYGLAGTWLSHDQAVARFLETFEQGFADPKYVGNGKDRRERSARWRRAHEAFVEAFSRGEGERLLAVGDVDELVRRALLVERHVRALQNATEKPSFEEALRDPAGARCYFAAMFDLLSADAPARPRGTGTGSPSVSARPSARRSRRSTAPRSRSCCANWRGSGGGRGSGGSRARGSRSSSSATVSCHRWAARSRSRARWARGPRFAFSCHSGRGPLHRDRSAAWAPCWATGFRLPAAGTHGRSSWLRPLAVAHPLLREMRLATGRTTMDPISDRPPTSPYGVIRDAQKAMDAGAVRLIDGTAQGLTAALAGGNAPPAAPFEAAPTRGRPFTSSRRSREARQMAKRIVVVASASGANHQRVRALVRWTRALVPAGVLVVSSGDASTHSASEEGIRLDAEEIPSGPLSLADALARAAKLFAA